jgi:hypothetical protein
MVGVIPYVGAAIGIYDCAAVGMYAEVVAIGATVSYMVAVGMPVVYEGVVV